MRRNIHQIKIGAILAYLSMGIGVLVNLIYTPIMIRILGQNEYGVYNVSASIIAYLGVLNFGFGSTYIRYYSKFKSRNDSQSISKLNGMFIIIFSVVSVLSLIAGVMISNFSDVIYGDKFTSDEIQIGKILLIILSVNIAIKFPNIVFSAFITSNERFAFLKSVDLLRNLLSPFLILPFLLMGYGSIGIAVVTTVISLLIEITFMVYSFRKLKMTIKFKGLDLALFREMLFFSSFIFINIVVDQINWNVDKYLIGRYHGAIPVAIYSLGTFFNTQYIQISTAISTLFVPRIHRIIQQIDYQKELSSIFIKVGRIQYILLLILYSGFIYFGKYFITAWAGSDYIASYFIVIILITAITIDLIQNLAIEIMRALNKQGFRTFIFTVFAIINIGISIPLTINYQGIGAAIGTGISVLIGNGIIMNIYYAKELKLEIKNFWINILHITLSLIPTFVFGYILKSILDTNSLWGFLVACSLYTLSYIANLWLLSLNSFEKNTIMKTFVSIKSLLKKGGK